MGLFSKFKNTFFDADKASQWKDAVPILAKYQVDRKIEGNVLLKGGGRCNLLLEENALVSIDGGFKGIVVGKPGAILRITNDFQGLIVCQELMLMGDANVNANVYFETITIKEGIILEGKATKMAFNFSELKVKDLKKMLPEDFENRYLLTSS